MRKTFKKLITVGAVLVLAGILVLGAINVFATKYYHVDSETVTKGTLTGDYKFTFSLDEVYEQLTEEDDGDKDLDYNPTQEYIVSGTSEFGTFAACIQTKADSAYCSYWEEDDDAGALTGDNVLLTPTGVGFHNGWGSQSPGAGAHWDKVDDDPPHDTDATYIITAAGNKGLDTYQLEDLDFSMSPGIKESGSITSFSWSRAETVVGPTYTNNTIYDVATLYDEGQEVPIITYTNNTWVIATNPNTLSEWTFAEINAVEVGVYGESPAPQFEVIRCTSVGVVVPTQNLNYVLNLQYNLTTLPASADYYNLTVTAMRDIDTENVNIQVYNFNSPSWTTRATISTDSFADYTYTLTSDEISTGNARVRFVDASGGDTTQTNLSVDWVNMRADYINYTGVLVQKMIDMDTGNYTFRINGYKANDNWHVQFYDWVDAGYDTVIASAFLGTPATRQVPVTNKYLSESVKGDLWIRYLDADTSGNTQSNLYLDLVEVYGKDSVSIATVKSNFSYSYNQWTGEVKLIGRGFSYSPGGITNRTWYVDDEIISYNKTTSFYTSNPLLRPFTTETHYITYVVKDAGGTSVKMEKIACPGNLIFILITVFVVLLIGILAYVRHEHKKEVENRGKKYVPPGY